MTTGAAHSGLRGLNPKEFGEIPSENIPWIPFAEFPPSARIAILVGDTATAGPYVIRVKVPDGVKLMPHTHPEDRIYTVISGVFYIGLGSTFDAEKLKAHDLRRVLHWFGHHIRRRKTESPRARKRHRPPGKYAALSLGEIGRIRYASKRQRPARPSVP